MRQAVNAALGATLLFSTNLVAIVSAVAIMFLWMGFHPNIREEIRARTFHGGLLSTGLLLVTITVILASLSLTSVKQASGGDAFAVLTSAKCTNEENFLVAKLTRQVLATNSIDHCARL